VRKGEKERGVGEKEKEGERRGERRDWERRGETERDGERRSEESIVGETLNIYIYIYI